MRHRSGLVHLAFFKGLKKDYSVMYIPRYNNRKNIELVNISLPITTPEPTVVQSSARVFHCSPSLGSF